MTAAAPAPQRAAPAAARRRAHRALAREVRRQAANFYYPFLLLPPRRRRAIFALYGFCRGADDVADGPGSAAQRREGLRRYRQALQATLDGHPPSSRWLALADAIEAFRLDPAPLHTIVDGCAADCA
ncbi:MAG TPA: squalene/phytoene synthase family protein, partial [Candidatus Dormibacteraeota bacterium]|nr:squalene/phytoene synthase family protein [Candidatus Dormibacteraeota bacterium]